MFLGETKDKLLKSTVANDQIYLRIQMKIRSLPIAWPTHHTTFIFSWTQQKYAHNTPSLKNKIAWFEYFSNLCPNAQRQRCVFFVSVASRFCHCFASHSLSLSYYAIIMGTHYLTMHTYWRRNCRIKVPYYLVWICRLCELESGIACV